MDEEVETFEGEIVMLVPMRSPLSSVWIATGDGAPPKVSIGAPGLPPELVLRLANNRRPDGPYLHAERVRAGLLALDPKPHQRGDESRAGGGISVGQGTRAPTDHPGERAEADADLTAETAAWLVKQDGRQFVLVLPAGPDSFDIADTIAPMMTGRYGIQPLKSGQMTLAGDYLVPGWRVLVDPSHAAEPSGPRAMH